MTKKWVRDYVIPDKLNYLNFERSLGMKERMREGEITICQQLCQQRGALCQRGEEKTSVNLIASKAVYFSGILERVSNLLERLLDL